MPIFQLFWESDQRVMIVVVLLQIKDAKKTTNVPGGAGTMIYIKFTCQLKLMCLSLFLPTYLSYKTIDVLNSCQSPYLCAPCYLQPLALLLPWRNLTSKNLQLFGNLHIYVHLFLFIAPYLSIQKSRYN